MTMSGRTGGVLPLLLLASFLSSFRPVLAIEFDMVFQTKCIFKEVMDDELVITGEFEAFKRDHPADKVKLNLRVESPLGEMVIEKRDVSSSDFKIDHPEAGDYKLCFTTKDYQAAQNTRIYFNWKEGVDAEDWESVAKKENLDSVHTELLRLEAAVHVIHMELQQVRRKEEQMRDVNERTNARVAWCSIGALITCVGMAVLQIFNLRKFFVRKKLL